MAVETKKYVSLDKLTKYDTKIKALIDTKDAATLASANAYADGLASNYDAAGAAATVQGKLDKEIARAEAAEAAALKAGQDAQADVDALETLVGTLPAEATATDIVGYVQEKTAGIATDAALAELQGKVTTAQNAIDAIEEDYLVAADKTELANAISAEESRAKGIEGGLETRLKAVEDDHLVAADKTALEGSIAAAQKAADDVQAEMDAFKLAAEVGDAAVDTLKEIQNYITTDGQAAAKMTEDIGANADAIDALSGRMDTAEDDIDAVEGRMDTAEADIDALQALFGEGDGTVADMIADAVGAEATLREQGDATANAAAAAASQAAATAQAAAEAAQDAADTAQGEVDALEGVVATKAAQADLEALTGRVTTAEGKITTLEGEMDAVEAAADANAKAIAALQEASATHATKTALQEEIDRAKAAEEANAAAIAAFVEVSEQEINDLFA